MKRFVLLSIALLVFGVLVLSVYQESLVGPEVPAEDQSESKKGHVTFSLDAQYESVELGKESLFVLTFEMEPGWHIYGREPGRFGFPTTFVLESAGQRWRSEAGSEEMEVRWPAPTVKVDEEGEESYLYDEPFSVVIGPLAIKEGSPRVDTHLPIHVEARWLECSEELCIPKRVKRIQPIPVRSSEDHHPAETLAYRRALSQW